MLYVILIYPIKSCLFYLPNSRCLSYKLQLKYITYNLQIICTVVPCSYHTLLLGAFGNISYVWKYLESMKKTPKANNLITSSF